MLLIFLFIAHYFDTKHGEVIVRFSPVTMFLDLGTQHVNGLL